MVVGRLVVMVDDPGELVGALRQERRERPGTDLGMMERRRSDT
jgi:hypothetical protein